MGVLKMAALQVAGTLCGTEALEMAETGNPVACLIAAFVCDAAVLPVLATFAGFDVTAAVAVNPFTRTDPGSLMLVLRL
jgi:hypothetical protein